jgi:Fe-coproporphyrin III synthase
VNPIIESLPVLILSPHPRCNCRCLMCDIWKESAQSGMSAAQFDQYLADIKRLSVEWVVFSGGEPLMHSDLFRFSASLRSLGIRTTVLSTGLLLAEHACRIVENVDDVIVSLDGPPAIHDRIRRVKGACEKLAQGVRAIHQIDHLFPISARCTVQKANHSSLRATANAARAMGLNSISFLAADVTSEAFNRPGGWDAPRQQKVALDESEIAVLEHELDQMCSEWSGTAFLREDRTKLARIALHYRAHLGLSAPVAPECNAPWASAVVEADGTVRPCFFHRVVGTVNGLSLAQVLNGPEAVQFRRNLDVATNPVCQRCVCSLNWQPAKRKRPSTEFILDSLSPAPRPAHYDTTLDAWVLSKYEDVVAAMHEARLCHVDSRVSSLPSREELNEQRKLRTAVLTACSGQHIRLWETEFRRVAERTITSSTAHNGHQRAKAKTACARESLACQTSVDIIGGFAQPWALEAAVLITGADRSDRHRLNDLARQVAMSSADPTNEAMRQAAKAADAELARSLKESPIPMSGPAFVAVSHTLPRFLANAWMALLEHPGEMERLRREPDLMPSAIEELLRYAGLAHTVVRRASAALHVAGVTIAQGDRVMLKISSANRDPAQFRDPDRLDFSRRNGPQLGLGTGPHSCAGGLLIRTLAGIATAVFVKDVSALDETRPVEWIGGSGYRSVKSLYVFLRPAPQQKL